MNEWQTLTLADVCTVITDGAHQSPKTVSRGKPMASVKDLTRFGVDLTSARHIATEDFEALVKQGCKPHVGDVLIAKDGNSALDTVCTVDHPLDAVLLSSVAILRPDPKCLDSVFLKFYLSSPETIDYLKSNFISGAAIPRVVLRDFKRAEIRLPSLDVQRRIAGVLQSIDSKIDLNRRVNQTLEAMAQAIFQSWFVEFDPVKAKIAAKQEGRDPLRAAMTAVSGKADAELDALPPEQYEQLAATAVLFPDEMEESEYGEIPKGWGFRSVADVAEFGRGKVDVSILNEDTYISTENMLENRGGVSRATSLPSVATVPSFKTGQILVSNIRPYFKKIWMAHFDGGRSPDVLAFEPIVPQSTEFLYNLMYQDAFFEFMTRTAKGAKMPRGDKDAITGWRFPCPDEALMVYFSEKVRPYYEYINSLKSENDSLAELRDTLLPKLLSGELSVTDAMVEAEA